MTTSTNRKGFKDLIVWQKSMDLVVDLYSATESFPSKEMYGLTNQIRRAAVSIPSNLAEGSKRGSKKDFRQFVLISYGSAAEISTQLEISLRLKYLNENEFKKLSYNLDNIQRMLHKLGVVLQQKTTDK